MVNVSTNSGTPNNAIMLLINKKERTVDMCGNLD